MSSDSPGRNTPSAPLFIARITQWMQARQPSRPLRGLTRLGKLLDRWLPAYQGQMRFPDGTLFYVDTRENGQSWLLYSGDHQPAVTNTLRQWTRPGDCCLDVGAFLGYYAVKFAHWAGPTGKVVTFEADPGLVKRVSENIALNRFTNVQIVNKAVHSQSIPITFHINVQDGLSSVYAPPASL